jgi:hypothetical protein
MIKKLLFDGLLRRERVETPRDFRGKLELASESRGNQIEIPQNLNQLTQQSHRSFEISTTAISNFTNEFPLALTKLK